MDAFDKLEIWKRSARLSVSIYRSLAGCREYGFKDQLFRSALSIPSNIAEGYERGTRREYLRYLHIAKGSCGELRTQLYIGIEAGILDKPEAFVFVQEAGALSRMLQALINRIRDLPEE